MINGVLRHICRRLELTAGRGFCPASRVDLRLDGVAAKLPPTGRVRMMVHDEAAEATGCGARTARGDSKCFFDLQGIALAGSGSKMPLNNREKTS